MYKKLRLWAYRQLLFLDPVEDDSIQARTQLWRDTEQTITHLLTLHGSTPKEEAEILLTLFVLLQIGTRDFSILQTVINRTYHILPRLRTAVSLQSPSQFHLLPHLLVHLYNETEDETLLPTIEHHLSTWTDATMTEEDHNLLEFYNTIDITA
ncbi:MAG: hypothetical protein IJ635_11735 [Bacteroidaceae bacterium]|nr:hypothetical protein [Bacteroidaceae bacterium]